MEKMFKNYEIEKEYRYNIARSNNTAVLRFRYDKMVSRCNNRDNKTPAYEDVDLGFKDFDDFAMWFYNDQDSFRWFKDVKDYSKRYEYQLDKDIIGNILGLREYSRKTCVFVPKYINTMIETNAGQRRDLPIGVTMGRVLSCGQTYSVYTTVFGKDSHILIDRSARTPEFAHIEYKLCKEYIIHRTAEEFYKRGLITPLVYYALITYLVNDDTKQVVNIRPQEIIHTRRILTDRGIFKKLESKIQEFTIPELDKMAQVIDIYPMKDLHELLGPYERSILFKYFYQGIKPTEEEYNGVFKRRLEDMTNGDFTIPKFSDYDFSKMRK